MKKFLAQVEVMKIFKTIKVTKNSIEVAAYIHLKQ